MCVCRENRIEQKEILFQQGFALQRQLPKISVVIENKTFNIFIKAVYLIRMVNRGVVKLSKLDNSSKSKEENPFLRFSMTLRF